MTGFEPLDGPKNTMSDEEALTYTDAVFQEARQRNRQSSRVVSGFKLRVHRPGRNITSWARLIARHRVQLLVLVQPNVLKDALTTSFNQRVFCELLCLGRRHHGGRRSDGANFSMVSMNSTAAKKEELRSLCATSLPSECVNVFGSVLQFFWQYTNISREAIERVAPVSLSVSETVDRVFKTAVSNSHRLIMQQMLSNMRITWHATRAHPVWRVSTQYVTCTMCMRVACASTFARTRVPAQATNFDLIRISRELMRLYAGQRAQVRPAVLLKSQDLEASIETQRDLVFQTLGLSSLGKDTSATMPDVSGDGALPRVTQSAWCRRVDRVRRMPQRKCKCPMDLRAPHRQSPDSLRPRKT